MPRGQSGPGRELPGVFELIDVGKFANDDMCGDFADARDGLDQFVFGLELGVLLDESVDFRAYCRDLF